MECFNVIAFHVLTFSPFPSINTPSPPLTPLSHAKMPSSNPPQQCPMPEEGSGGLPDDGLADRIEDVLALLELIADRLGVDLSDAAS